MDKKSEFQCKLCPHIAQNHEFLQIHAKMHVGRREFRCTDCNFSASQLKTLENHLQWHNKPLLRRRKEFPVSLDTSSNSSTDMPNNGITSNTSGSYGHKKPNFNCPDCPFKTRIPERLNDHEKYHEDPGKFSCKSCSFSANDQGKKFYPYEMDFQ